MAEAVVSFEGHFREVACKSTLSRFETGFNPV